MKYTLKTLMASTLLVGVLEGASPSEKIIGIPEIRFGSDQRGASPIGMAVGTLSYTHQFDSDFDSLGGEMSSDQFSMWIPVLPLNFGDVHVLAYLGYQWAEFDTSVPNLLTGDSLQAIQMPIGVFYEPADRWLIGGGVMPGYAGNSSSSDNFSMSAAVAAGYEVNKDLIVYGGVYYFDGFDDTIVIPGVAFDWQICDRWSAYVLGPVGGISYEVSNTWLISLVGQYEAPTWHLEADDQGPDRDLTMSSFRLGLRSEHQIGGFGWGYITAGYSFLREMEIEDLDSKTLQKSDIDSGPYVQVGMNLRF